MRLLAVVLVVRLLAAPAVAEEPEQPDSVLFDEDMHVRDALRQASALAAKGEAKAAAACLEQVASEHASQVERVGEGLFLPAWRVAHRRLGELAPVVRAAYVEANGAKARAELAAAGDLDALAKAVEGRLGALPAEEAASAAARLAEGGRANEAEAILEELVLLGEASARAVFALARSCAVRGERASVARIAKAIPPGLLRETLEAGGETRTLAELLERLAQAPEAAPALAAEPGGSVGPVVECGEPADAPAWSEELPVLADALKEPKGKRDVDDRWLPVARVAGTPTLSAAIVGDRVVVNLGKSLFAFRLSDGEQDWTRGGERGLAAYLTTPAARDFHAILAEGERIYATVAMKGGVDLLCVTAASGKLLWDFADCKEGKDLSVLGAPLLHGSSIYFAVVSAKEPGRVFVVRASAADGRVLWRQPFCSHSTPGEDNPGAASCEASLAVSRGVLCVCSGGGAFAALDAESGAFLWGLKYALPGPVEDPRRIARSGWREAYSPLLPTPEGIWMAPCDVRRYFLVDTSERKFALSRRKDTGERYRFLLGCDGGSLVLGGQELGRYAPGKGLERHMELGAAEGRSRPALARGILLVPRSKCLLAIDTAAFKEVWSRPLSAGQSGDVLVSAKGIVLVSQTRITFFPWK